MLRGDEQWLKAYLPAARSIAAWYEQFLRDDKSLSHIPYWFFADWADGFNYGEPNYGEDGSSAYQDLVYILALRELADMEEAFGIKEMGKYFRNLAYEMASTIRYKYYDSDRKLLADTRDRDVYSQHVNALAILAGIFADEWQSTLQPWQNQIELGLTTWAENPEPSRSDCHAWSSSPNIEIYRMLLGIHSAVPGFQEILITPALGGLTEVSGTMPHPAGMISVDYKMKGNTLVAAIVLPEGIKGKIIWNGMEEPLRPGKQTINLKP